MDHTVDLRWSAEVGWRQGDKVIQLDYDNDGTQDILLYERSSITGDFAVLSGSNGSILHQSPTYSIAS